MEKHLILGADPGKHGGIVLIDDRDLNKQVHIPTKVLDGHIDVIDLYNKILPYQDIIRCAVKEEVHALFGSSAKGTFCFGSADGELYSLLMILGKDHFPVYTVQPKQWQTVAWKKVAIINGTPIMDSKTGKQKVNKAGDLRFKTDTKATSLSAATYLFPNVSFIPKRARIPHDGLVDAALIAYYAYAKNLK